MRGWLLVLAGCYAPSAPAGVPCADNGACPSGQMCVAGTCGGTLPEDAAGGDAPAFDATVTVDSASPDAAQPTDCWAAWADGKPQLSMASLMFSSSDDDLNPSLSSDRLALYFSRKGDFYRAMRSSPTASFGGSLPITDLSSTATEDKLTLSGDGLTAVLSSNRTPLVGDYDLWIATRSAIGTAFSTPTRLPTSVNSPDSQFDPWLSADGLTLYWAEGSVIPMAASHLRKATRSSSTASFNPSAVSIDAAQPFNPVLSPDQLVIVYSDSGAISVATRTMVTGPFKDGHPLSGLPAGADNPELSRDGCELVFDAPGATSQDIFHAFVMP